MARRVSASPEISLFPFLSILVCIIGALVLLITVLTIAQGTAGDGRTPEEMQRALTFQSLTQKLKDLTVERDRFAQSAGTAGQTAMQIRRQEELAITLRRELAELEKPAAPGDTDAELQKRLELARQQLAAMAAEKPGLEKEIVRMEAELAAWVTENNSRLPIVAFMAGRFMDEMPGMSFGHAGTIVEGKEDTATEKSARLAEAGITVAEEISEIPSIIKAKIAERSAA